MKELAGAKGIKVALLTGSVDPHYQIDLLTGLVSSNTKVDFIGGDSMAGFPILAHKNVSFFNLRGDQSPSATTLQKIRRVLKYYLKLIAHAVKSDCAVFHIQWPNKFVFFDRTVLNLFYKLLGKKLVFTAHNVNSNERDGNDNIFNRLSLRFMYNTVDHIIVHTEKMKRSLIENFDVRLSKITVIPHGINNALPRSGMTENEARKRLGLKQRSKVLLFFGNIAPYKGLEYLVSALAILKEKYRDIKLIIAGRIRVDSKQYWEEVSKTISKLDLDDFVIRRIEFIPDGDVEMYCMGSDVMVLPYTCIFQSGIIFVSFSFGLPVIASDVGSLSEDVLEGKTGYVCRPEDPSDLARKIVTYFDSDIYKNLSAKRKEIIDYARGKYSWEKIGRMTAKIYRDILTKAEKNL